HKEIRTFGTMTDELLQLGDWLAAAGCTHVAMESTGIYLEADLQPAGRQLRAAPGQRPAYEAGAWSQDRRARLRVDRRPAAAWPAARQLRAGSSAAGAP